MTDSFQCSIVTPSESVFEDQIKYASVPAWDGQLGVMTGQSPVLTRLGTGGLRLSLADGATRWFLIDGGFAQVQNDTLTLLCDHAEAADALSLDEAQAELAEARSRVAADGEDAGRVYADQQRAMAKVAVIKSAG